MKYLNCEDIDWDDFDFEEESLIFKVGDEVYIKNNYNIQTISHTLIYPYRGLINEKYIKSFIFNAKGIIDEIRMTKDNIPVFRLKGQWPFRKFDNWKNIY